MKLLGRDIPARELIARIEERLRTRGLPTSEPVEIPAEGVEPRVEPLTFNLHALEEHSDATRALPLHTHRGGVGQLVVVAKWAFRKTCQVFINEALGRQRVFNGHVRDSYAQLSAEVLRLRREVEQLRARQSAPALVEEPRRQQTPTTRQELVISRAATAPASATDGDLVLPKPRTTTAKKENAQAHPEPAQRPEPSSTRLERKDASVPQPPTQDAPTSAKSPSTSSKGSPLRGAGARNARTPGKAKPRPVAGNKGTPPTDVAANAASSNAPQPTSASAANREPHGAGKATGRAGKMNRPPHGGGKPTGHAGSRSGKASRRPRRR
ncbi:hypothetical protein LZ198_07545 [Myxococcus sp. K15C18031901]|uniref:hypothetical protein n=1 Tax=Myxococcus dinghuensis TaxID=2906761 RepID=UPI0020A7D1C3|nr:hypothetical protein [Myxococcus dinghuensis]MCP3098728.1 hypothetical protein [Myxococcus dinghuensis]